MEVNFILELMATMCGLVVLGPHVRSEASRSHARVKNRRANRAGVCISTNLGEFVLLVG